MPLLALLIFIAALLAALGANGAWWWLAAPAWLGSISRHHLPGQGEAGGELVREVASGYFGCRDAVGHFDPARFASPARSPQVKKSRSSCRRVPGPAMAA